MGASPTATRYAGSSAAARPWAPTCSRVTTRARWARAPSPTFRPAWKTDLTLTVLNGLVVERLAAAVAGWIALGLSRVWAPDALGVLEGAPLWLQLPLLLLLADLIFYWLHWAFHRVPALWALHKVHHSSEHLDWLVSSRS